MLDIMNDIKVKHYNSNWYCGTGKKRKRLNIDAKGYSYRYNSLFLSFELLLTLLLYCCSGILVMMKMMS